MPVLILSPESTNMPANQPSPASISIRLSIMMFLQFFIWGAWYVTGPNYLAGIGFGAADFGWMYSVGPIAGMISPFFVGMIADRFFSTERVLAAMHLMAGGAMVVAIVFMKAADPSPNMINLMFFAHMLCYFPTLALTNALAMKNMTNAEKQFPLIRVFGTIGWIVAGLTLTALAFDKKIEMFYIAAGSSILMGVYSVFLPHTPPVKSEHAPTFGEIIGLDAFTLFKNRSFLVFMVASFLICIPLAFYYQIASRAVEQTGLPPALTMSYGQMSEIFFMLVMPLFFARLGVKYMLVLGMLAWVARYALFAVGAPDQVVWMMIGGVVLHGICYDFFFVTGQIYTDKIAPKAIRGQAQGMLVLFTLGLGMFIGAQVAGRIEAKGTPVATPIQQGEAGVAGAIAALGDEEGVTVAKVQETSAEQVSIAETALADAREAGGSTEVPEAVLAFAQAQHLEMMALSDRAELDEVIADRKELQGAKSLGALRSMDWKFIWGVPAGMAGVVLILFFLLFKDDKSKYADHGNPDSVDAEAIAKADAADPMP
jgi:nucleoside transporter